METPPPQASRITIHPSRYNANTRLPAGPEPLTFARAAMAEAMEVARALSQALPSPSTVGYRLFWSCAGRQGSLEIPTADGAYVIVGRHGCCDVVLERDPEIALRHLLLRAEPKPGGGALLRVLDLHATLPVLLEDGTQLRSALADGPLKMRLGTYALIALPNGAPANADVPPPIVEHCAGSPYRDPPPRPSRNTLVSMLPRPPLLEEVSGSNDGVARVRLAGPGGGLELDLSEPTLQRGVLLGRAAKCQMQLNPTAQTLTSRVHLLLLRERERTYAFDLASMNGTFLNGARVKRVVLGSTPVTLGLGGPQVTMQWIPRS